MKLRIAVFVFACVTILPQLCNAQEAASSVKTEEQKTFHVIGLAVRTNNKQEAGGQGEIPKLWQRFMQQGISGKIPNRVDDGLLVVYTDYESDQTGEYTYLIGARVTTAADVPAGLTLKEIPAGRYAVIATDKGPVESVIPKAWQHIWSMSAKDFGGERAFQADYEVYPQGFEPQNARVDIYIGLK